MTLDELMKRVAEFSDTTFGTDRPFTAPLYHLKKEVDEAIESGEHSEFADCLMLVLDAYRKKFPNSSTDNLIQEASRKVDICYTREWGAPDENGVREHIRK